VVLGEVPLSNDSARFTDDRHGCTDYDSARFGVDSAFDDDCSTGAGLGASHQTGWTGFVAKLIQQQRDFGTITERSDS
jgi:hypothetical protein